MLFQRMYQLCHRTILLSNSHIDTIYRFSFIVKRFLIDDSIYGNGRFSSLSVANDKLPLSASNGNHRINSFYSSLKWLVNRLTKNYFWRFSLQWHFVEFTCDGAFPIHRLPQSVYDPASHSFAYINRGNSTSTPNYIPFAHQVRRTKQNNTHIVLL